MAELPAPPRGSGVFGGVTVSAEQIAFVASGVNRGLSANAIQQAMAGTELALRRQAVQEVVREVNGSQERAPGLQNTNPAFIPSEGLFYPTSRVVSEKYRVYASVEAQDRTTGETRTLRAIVSFPELVTRSEINDLVSLQMSAAQESYNLTWSSAEIRYSSLLRRGV